MGKLKSFLITKEEELERIDWELQCEQDNAMMVEQQIEDLDIRLGMLEHNISILEKEKELLESLTEEDMKAEHAYKEFKEDK
jgi:hypothetical protein